VLKCGGMASGRTCPHDDADRLLVSGTKLRKWLAEGSPVPAEFSRPRFWKSCAHTMRRSIPVKMWSELLP